MTDKIKTAITWIALATSLGLAGYTAYKFVAEDEDRPPIIVKSGSLIFENGDDAQNQGKPWHEPNAKQEWQLDHPKGRPTKQFHAIFVGGTGDCAPKYITEAVIYYKYMKDQNEETAQFTVTTRQRSPQGGTKAPAILGADLVKDNSGYIKTLKFDQAGTIDRVTAGGATCTAPGWMMFRPLN